MLIADSPGQRAVIQGMVTMEAPVSSEGSESAWPAKKPPKAG